MRLAAMLGVAALLACNPNEGPASDEGADDEPAEVFEEPEFLEPAGGEVMLTVDRTEDLELEVRGIRPGLTRVLIDEQSIGTAQDDASPAILDPDLVTLRLTGAMIVGEHTLQLRTVAPNEILESEVITLFISGSTFADLAAEMNDAVVFEADVVDAQGHGEEGVLLGLDLGTDPVIATVAPARGTGWALGERVELELPGFERTDEPRFTATGAMQNTTEQQRLRLAWRSGEEGRVMLGSDLLWPPASIQVQPVVDLSLDLPGYEYSRLGRPLLLGDTLVMEALLATDVEQPTPGSRTLLTSHLDPDTGRFTPPQISAVGDGRDIDRIEPVRDLLTHALGGTPGFSARAAGIRAVVYDVDASTGTLSERPSGSNDRFSSLRDVNGPIHAILGPLQSRHAFAPLRADEPRVFMRQFDDRPRGGSEDVAPGANALSSISDITAPVTSTVIGGLPVFLVPQGINAPVVAIVSGNTVPRVLALDGLACDELAVPVTPDTAEAGRIDVACRRGRSVHRGTIRIVEDA